MPRLLLTCATAVCLALGVPVSSTAQETPTTQPAEPSAQAAFVARLVTNLRDADPLVRAAARRAMLRLDVGDVPLLADALRGRGDLRGETGEVGLVVREVLDHLYLRRAKRQYHAMLDAGQLSQQRGDGAFLGISLPLPASVYGGQDGGFAGVMVVSTLMGFAAYETLEAGDVVLEIDFGDGRRVPLDSGTALQGIVGGLAPGLAVDLRVVRGGQVLRLPFVLDRAVETTTPAWLQLTAAAKNGATEAWQTRFAPLFDRPAQADARRH